MDKHKIQSIITRYNGIKLRDCNYPVLLSGYRSFTQRSTYRATNNIMLVINARAYYMRCKKLMQSVVKKINDGSYTTPIY